MSKFMNRPPPSIMSTAPPTSSTFVEKIMIGLDHAPPAFDLRGQLIGGGGANLHYIRAETGAMATLRGRGSKYIDPTLGVESPEPMHLYIEHTRFDGLQSAKQLAKNLIETLQQELIHFQQMNPPMQTVQYSQSTVMQSQQVMNAQQTVVSQMSVPPPMLAVPPPVIQSNNIETLNNPPTSIIQQQAMLSSQNMQTIGATVQQAPQQQTTSAQTQQTTILQQQTIMPQSMPIHLHHGNMVIQQQVPANSVNIPQSGIHIKQAPLVHLQAPPPTSIQLSQPPPNIQIQQQQPTQILLNQSQPNYQYQYIQQQPLQTADGQQNQVTIQHIYQPVQQAMQPTAHLNQFTTTQTIRPAQHQQYIVQGNTGITYMVPPPNIIQQTQPPPQPQHNIIFQTAPPQPGTMHLQQLQLHPPPNIVETNANNTEDTVKEERNSPEPSESDSKPDEKPDTENLSNENSTSTQLAPPPLLQQPPPPISLSQQMQMRPPNQITTTAALTQVPPPMMAAPPPSCIQHIVGNTLITASQPSQTQTHQIYNQIPVSIQTPQQQIHVSAPNGQHFLVNAQQWQQSQQQFQQVTSNGNIQGIQSIQLTATQPINQTIIGSTSHNGDMRGNLQPQQILTTSFNPHVPAPAVSGMQVQFQPIQATQQIMQPIDNHHHHHHHHHQQLVDQQQAQLQAAQQQTHIISSTLHQPPPPPPPVSVSYMDTQQKMNGLTQYSTQGNAQHSIQYPHQMNMAEQLRMVHKRKRDSNDTDDLGPPKIGMGSNIGGKYFINQRDVHHSSNVSTNSNMIIATTASGPITTSSSNQDEVTGNNNRNSPIIYTSNANQTSQTLTQLNSAPTFMSDNRQMYRLPFDATSQPPPPPPPGGPGLRGQRFSNNRNDFNRPQHMNDGNFQMHRMNLGPPPLPPPMYPRMPPQPRFRGGQW